MGVGARVGSGNVGDTDGFIGALDGANIGFLLGLAVGCELGNVLGRPVGWPLGLLVIVGNAVGLHVG